MKTVSFSFSEMLQSGAQAADSPTSFGAVLTLPLSTVSSPLACAVVRFYHLLLDVMQDNLYFTRLRLISEVYVFACSLKKCI